MMRANIFAALFIVQSAAVCTVDFNIYTQPPFFPTGMNAGLSVIAPPTNFWNKIIKNSWSVSFTAKGFGSADPFNITSYWNAGTLRKSSTRDDTTTYTLTNAIYNGKLSPSFGFLASTTLTSPKNNICGVTLNGEQCDLSPTSMAPYPAVPSNTVDLFYTVNGCGPLIVLIHGITESSKSWDPIVPLLSRYYKVVTVDMRGHGRSPFASSYEASEMAADIYKVVRKVSGNNELPFVIGHSLGGVIASVYAHFFPVRGLVCIDQSLDLASFQANIKAVEPQLRDPQTCPFVIQALFNSLYGGLQQTEINRLESFRRVDQSVILGVYKVLFDYTPSQLAAYVDAIITTPGGLYYQSVFGFPPGEDYQGWLQQRAPSAVVSIYNPNNVTTHYPHLVDPALFVQKVRAYEIEAASTLCTAFKHIPGRC